MSRTRRPHSPHSQFPVRLSLPHPDWMKCAAKHMRVMRSCSRPWADTRFGCADRLVQARACWRAASPASWKISRHSARSNSRRSRPSSGRCGRSRADRRSVLRTSAPQPRRCSAAARLYVLEKSLGRMVVCSFSMSYPSSQGRCSRACANRWKKAKSGCSARANGRAFPLRFS